MWYDGVGGTLSHATPNHSALRPNQLQNSKTVLTAASSHATYLSVRVTLALSGNQAFICGVIVFIDSGDPAGNSISEQSHHRESGIVVCVGASHSGKACSRCSIEISGTLE